MSPTKSVPESILVPNHELTKNQWLQMITYRFNRLKKHLLHLTLTPLEKLHIIDYGPTHTLTDNGVKLTGIAQEILSIYGLYFLFPRVDQEQWNYDKKQIERHGWGITRKGKIVHIIVCLHIVDIQEMEKKKYGKVGNVKSLHVKESDFDSVLAHYSAPNLQSTQSGPEYIWRKLGQIIKGFAAKRRALYVTARNLELEVESEERLLSLTQS